MDNELAEIVDTGEEPVVESIPQLMQDLTVAIQEWKELQSKGQEVEVTINRIRRKLADEGIHMQLEDFDKAVSAPQKVVAMTPPSTGNAREGLRAPEVTEVEPEDEDADAEIDIDNLPDTAAPTDSRSAEQIRKEAMRVDASTEQDAATFSAGVGSRFAAAVTAGFNVSDRLAEDPYRSVHTRGLS